MEEMLNDLNESVSDGEVIEAEEPKHKVTSAILEDEADEAAEEVVDEFEEFVIDSATALTHQILQNCAEDRAEATAAIEMIKELIKDQGTVIHGGSLGRLLQAIDTRSSINTSTVKVMESLAKILSARKGPSKNITNNNQAVVGNDSLIAMLERGQKSK